MTKFNSISLIDAVDRLFDSFNSSYTVDTSLNTTAGDYQLGYTNFTPYSYGNYYNWNTVKVDLPSVSLPSYPVANGSIKEDGILFIHLAVTGMSKKEIIVKSEDQSLIVEGRISDELKNYFDSKKDKSLFHNLPIKNFDWKCKISTKYDLTKLEAKLENGLLEISIPLKEENKPVKKTFEIK